MNDLRARTVPLTSLSTTDTDRWSVLNDRALEPNPHVAPEYLVPAAEHIPAARDINIIIVEDGARMLTVLPLSIGRFRRFRYATTAGPFFGSNAPFCAPLIDASSSVAALDTLVRYLGSAESRLPGLVELTLLPGDGPLYESLHAAFHRNRVPVFEHYRFQRPAVRRPRHTRPPRAALSKNRRRAIDRHVRQLEKDLGAPTLHDRSDDRQAVEDFLRLEAAGWKGTSPGGEALAVVPGGAAWLRDLAERFRRRDALQVLALTAGDVTLYMAVSLRAGQSLYLFRDAYDERFREYGPGTLGRFLHQEHFVETRPELLLDTCIQPKYTNSTGFYSESRPIVGSFLGLRGPVARGLVRAARLRRRARSMTEQTGTQPSDPAQQKNGLQQ